MSSSMYGAGVEYALHSLLIMVTQPEPVSVRDLAAYQQIPERFLAKVFSRLKAARLVKATEGIAGGFVLARPAAQIQVLQVLDAVDSQRRLFACAEIRRNCALFDGKPAGWAIAGPCRIHAFMLEAEDGLRDFLGSKSVADLAGELGAKAPRAFQQATGTWFQQRRAARHTAVAAAVESSPGRNASGQKQARVPAQKKKPRSAQPK